MGLAGGRKQLERFSKVRVLKQVMPLNSDVR
jgi:hypothetical protein